MEHSKSSFKGKFISNTSLPQKIRKISHKQHNVTPEENEKKKSIKLIFKKKAKKGENTKSKINRN